MQVQWTPFVTSSQSDFEGYKREWLKGYHHYGTTLHRFRRKPEPHLRAIANCFTRATPLSPETVEKLKKRAGGAPWADFVQGLPGPPETWEDYVRWLERKYDQGWSEVYKLSGRMGWMSFLFGVLIFGLKFIVPATVAPGRQAGAYESALIGIGAPLVTVGFAALAGARWPGLAGKAFADPTED